MLHPLTFPVSFHQQVRFISAMTNVGLRYSLALIIGSLIALNMLAFWSTFDPYEYNLGTKV